MRQKNSCMTAPCHRAREVLEYLQFDMCASDYFEWPPNKSDSKSLVHNEKKALRPGYQCEQ